MGRRLRVDRVSTLHRIGTMSAASLWLSAESAALGSRTEERERKAGYWRDQTKTLAREWLQFTLAANLDPKGCIRAVSLGIRNGGLL